MEFQGHVDMTIPFWGLLTAFAASVIFIIVMHIRLEKLSDKLTATENKLSDRISTAETRLKSGDTLIKEMSTEMHKMSKILVKVDTKINFHFKIKEEEEG